MTSWRYPSKCFAEDSVAPAWIFFPFPPETCVGRRQSEASLNGPVFPGAPSEEGESRSGRRAWPRSRTASTGDARNLCPAKSAAEPGLEGRSEPAWDSTQGCPPAFGHPPGRLAPALAEPVQPAGRPSAPRSRAPLRHRRARTRVPGLPRRPSPPPRSPRRGRVSRPSLLLSLPAGQGERRRASPDTSRAPRRLVLAGREAELPPRVAFPAPDSAEAAGIGRLLPKGLRTEGFSMEKGAALCLTLIIATQALVSPSIANPEECREGEYLDDHGKCNPCKECGPGFELSKECGYGEGREAECSPCQPRRFKDRWGPHGCKSCLSCSLINRAQKSNCSTTSDATCGDCFPGFYSKTQIRGFQDLECVPCTKQTPSSEQQCLSRSGLEESSTDPTQDPALVVLTSSALALLALVLLTVAILYCQQFWKSQCQQVFLRSQNVSGQRVTFQTSAGPAGFHDLPPDACSLDFRNFRSLYSPPEGPVGALQFIPGPDVSGSRLPHPQPDTDWSKLVTVTSKTPTARSPLETQPLMGTSGLHSCSFHGGFSESSKDHSRGPDGLAQPASCARESQHCWPHAPVECTELDLQAFSAWAGKEAAKTGAPGKQKPPPEVLLPWSACPAAQAGLSLEVASVLGSSFQNQTLETGEPLRSSSSNVSLEQPPF